MVATVARAGGHPLQSYVPRLLADWAFDADDDRHLRVDGSLAFVDISGFTSLTERLARKGRVGAEEMSDLLSSTFAQLLTAAQVDGADLVKWGGDAVLLLFRGGDHAQRAARSAFRMRHLLRTAGRVRTTSGTVTLRMSVGVHSGAFDFFLVGDKDLHRELIVSGPGASRTAEMEAAASAGQIRLSEATARLLPAGLASASPDGVGWLLRREPQLDDIVVLPHQAAPIDPMEVLPRPIRHHLLSGAVEPEHRSVSIGFVQFMGTDEVFATQGPGGLSDALDECVRNVQRACADYDVTFFETDIARDGGKVMLTAGAPTSSGHDEERMLRAARSILDRGGRLPLRIGLNRGRVFAGDFGPPFRRTYSVKGDAVNLAARVMAAAPPGQLLATSEILARSRTVFRTTNLPPFLVKGKAEPVHAAVVGELVGAREPERSDVPLVGRETELHALGLILDDVRRRRGGLAEIVGEPGIGKSRLVEEMLRDVTDVTVISAPAEEYESSTPYFPFRTLLRRALGVPDGAGAATVEARLRHRVANNAPQLMPWLPLVGIPLDLELPATRETLELDEGFRRERLEDVVCDLMSWLLPTPTVFVLEDVHVIDEASAQLLRRIVDRTTREPWLVLVTRRDQAEGFVPEPGSAVKTLRPAPLDAAAATLLVQRALERHPLPRAAIESLAARAGGNPMFLEALVVEAGRSGSVADLPESVEALVTSQIDRLLPGDRTVLRYAAVLGNAVDEEALNRLLAGHAVEGALSRLGDFLVRDRDDSLAFRHELIRDAAYEGLPFRLRRELHSEVGEAIESGTDTPQSLAELLSMHFFHAGDYDKAWDYSIAAGQRARGKFGNADAVDFYQRAVESARRGAQVSTRDLSAAHEALGDAYFLIGLTHPAATAFERAGRLVRGDAVARAEIVVKQVRVDQRLRHFPTSLRRLTPSLRELDRDERPAARIARSHLATRYAVTRVSQGRVDEALKWGARAAREAEDAADKAALAQAYAVLHGMCVATGRVTDLPYGRLALLAYTELGDLTGQAHCLNNLAAQAHADGGWPQALVDFRRAAEYFRRTGDTASAGNALFNQADVLVRQGRFADAAPLLAEAREIAVLVEDEELDALVLRESGRLRARDGRPAEATESLARAAELFAGLDEPDELADVLVCQAEAAWLAGHLDDARAAVEQARAAATPTRPDACRVAAAILLAAGDVAGARREVAAGLAVAASPGDDYERALLLLTRSQADESSGGAADAADVERAGEILRHLGVVVTPYGRLEPVTGS